MLRETPFTIRGSEAAVAEDRAFQIGDSTLTLTIGDITTSEAEVVVSSDDTYLSMSGGVSEAIRSAAGPSLWTDTRKHAPASVGDVIVSTAGALPARYVFHAVTLEWNQPQMANTISRVTRRCMELANLLRGRSIAFPALGMGVAGYTKETVASEMVDVITAELRGSPHSMEVTIYLFPSAWTQTEVDFAPFLERFSTQPEPMSVPSANEAIASASAQLAGLRRVGVFSAQPVSLNYLYLGQEVRAVDKAFLEAPSEYRDQLWIVQSWATRPDDILSWLLRYQPHVVHFAGHASPGGEIVLESESGQPALVPVDAISELLHGTCPELRFVVLNACFSLSGAEKLLDQAGCVVGTRAEIADQAAVAFSGGFYRALAHGYSVQRAFEMGRASVQLYRLDPSVLQLVTRQGFDADSLKLVG
jgi:O-acetyl-ADP-ribose deacetylase (regulator of RNase III)